DAMARGSTATRSSTQRTDGASVLGKGARVRGRVQGSGDLRVEGRIDGDVTVTGDLVIDDGGGVTGDVDAASVVISGALTGDVARGPASIGATAQVSGNMGGSEVSLEEGAVFSGRIEAEFDLPAELTARHKGR